MTTTTTTRSRQRESPLICLAKLIARLTWLLEGPTLPPSHFLVPPLSGPLNSSGRHNSRRPDARQRPSDIHAAPASSSSSATAAVACHRHLSPAIIFQRATRRARPDFRFGSSCKRAGRLGQSCNVRRANNETCPPPGESHPFALDAHESSQADEGSKFKVRDKQIIYCGLSCRRHWLPAACRRPLLALWATGRARSTNKLGDCRSSAEYIADLAHNDSHNAPGSG